MGAEVNTVKMLVKDKTRNNFRSTFQLRVNCGERNNFCKSFRWFGGRVHLFWW